MLYVSRLNPIQGGRWLARGAARVARRMRVRSKVWIEAGGRLIFSDGRMALLDAIERLGSINKAARSLGMSYRGAWGKLRATEAHLGVRLLRRRIGGRGGGGATLTDEAREIMGKFRRIKRAVNRRADLSFARAFEGR